MKLVIFGATGKVGQYLVKQALDQGHRVLAFTRRPNSLSISHKHLKIIQGDVLDPTAVKMAIQGCDVVLIALGMPLRNKDKLRSKGTSIIVQAMQETGVNRLICLSGMGANDSHALLPAFHKFLLVPLMMRRLYADHEQQESIVSASGLDWTIARPAGFVAKGPHTGEYWHGFDPHARKLKFKISTPDVADFMLRQLTSDSYLHKSPSISY